MPERVDFWGIPHAWGPPELFVYSLMAIATAILAIRFYNHAKVWWKVGRPESRWDHILKRSWRVIGFAVIQIKVLKQRYPGLMHVCLAWGFFVFFLGTALATIDSHGFKFLEGNIYLIYKLVLDLFTILFFAGILMAVYRRYIEKPDRLTLTSRFTWTLLLLIFVVLGGLITESLRLAVERPPWGFWSPAGWVLAQLWIATGASDITLTTWHLIIWIIHLLSVALLIIILPVSTLLHLISSPLNIFFSKIERPFGKLKPIREDHSGEQIFASSLSDLSWKQLLDGDTCTECGRCQDACPAYLSGKPLNPKVLVLNIRDTLHHSGKNNGSDNGKSSALVGHIISDEILWSCTTCGACIQECPVLIEHIDVIVDMRRFLVIEGRIDDELQDALSNLGRYGNSFGQSARARARWTRSLEVEVKDARKEIVEYLWFLGDYASLCPTLSEITQKTAEVFNHAGLDFGILYEGEQNSGNDVRRVGEEGLFEMLVENNIEELNRSEHKFIVTTDPHSYNTLLNEYPSINGQNAPVLHYAQLLDQLISDGRLKFKNKLDLNVTFHDPCYLGRYNGIYDAPRRVIEATGCSITEMPRNRDKSYCCGAGGGRIWMSEGNVTERPSEARITEAVGLKNVTHFIVACPKDVTMYQDAVKTTANEEKIQVKDLIEIVHAAL